MIGHVCSHGHVTGRSHLITCVLTITCASDEQVRHSDLIDDYISSFENLLSRGEIPRTEVGAIEKFKDGLKYGVLATILRRDTWPTTIDDWEEAAR